MPFQGLRAQKRSDELFEINSGLFEPGTYFLRAPNLGPGLTNPGFFLFFLFFPLPFSTRFPLSDISCLHFRTDWLSRLGLGNQVGSTTDHLANCYLPSTPKDRSTMKEELTE